MNESSVMQESVKDSLAGVVAYQHPELIARYKRKLSLSQKDADELFLDVKRYLCLAVTTGKRLSPPVAIDAGWHEFILYTRDYADFCIQHFGVFVHHVPDQVLEPQSVSVGTLTLRLAHEAYGELSKHWNARYGTEGCSSACAVEVNGPGGDFSGKETRDLSY